MLPFFPSVTWRAPTMGAVVTCCLLGSLLQAQSWRSELYPDDWQRPDETASFYTDKLIQDFSFSGYKRGEESLPSIAGPIFDVTDPSYGADESGSSDSTLAIQSAIDAAETAGSGVVYLPAGEYRISPQGGNSHCLRISSSNIILRGAGAASTFLLNTATEMRSKKVLLIQPASTSTGSSVNFTADLNGPTRRLPVATPSNFSLGDIVRLQWDFTDAWIAEHGQGSYWSEAGGNPSDARYLREVTAINQAEGWVEVDVPTRYTMKTRDSARMMTRSGLLSGVGIESLAIGNVQHPGTSWGDNEYSDPTKPAYDVHASYLIQMRDSMDSWITGVESFQAAGNTSACHMLSNGIVINDCFRVTIKDSKMKRTQYGGGGGNGYMIRLQYSNDCLVQNFVAEFSRHGIVTSHAGTSGNVFLQCEDRETRRATGNTGSYTAGSSGSDNHMHFSHSNLWDGCLAHNSYYTASHRGNSGTVPHGLTSAHAIYWNTQGSGTRYNDIVKSNQGRYGYVIGTSGSKYGVDSSVSNDTSPEDHVEGVGTGDTLEPASLYLDQLSRRLTPRLSLTAGSVQLPNNTFEVLAGFTLDGESIGPASSLNWNLLNIPAGASIVTTDITDGRAYTVTHPGTYAIEATGSYEGQGDTTDIEVEVLAATSSGPIFDLFPVADSHVQSGTGGSTNFGSNGTLALKNDGGANVEREAFMRFDLSAIDTAAIDSAKLHLRFTSSGIDADGRTSVIDDSSNWGESTIIWNNRPTIQNALVGDWTPVPADWLELDTTSVLPSQLEANDTITFRHQILSQSGNSLYYIASRENSTPSLRPFLRLKMAPQTLEAWLADTTDLVAPNLDPGDDPDGDGIVNLLEAWLGTHAGQAEYDAMPQAALRNGKVEFDVQVNTNPPAGLFYYIQYSDTLGNDWQLAPGVVWETSGPAANGRQPMTASLSREPAANKRFYRIRVVTP